MKNISILDDVLGPIMRGPSSSHTAGSYHLAALARSLLGEEPARAELLFDAGGSYGKVYREQGSDLAFATGLMGWPITDGRFHRSLEMARAQGVEIAFRVGSLPVAEHPNEVRMTLAGTSGGSLALQGRSVGGGAIELHTLEGWPVLFSGSAHEVAAEMEAGAASAAAEILGADGAALAAPERRSRDGLALVTAHRSAALPEELRVRLAGLPGLRRLWQAQPIMLVKRGRAPFASAAEMVEQSRSQRLSAGGLGVAYEAGVLGAPEELVRSAMASRLSVMLGSVEQGQGPEAPPMQLLQPTAGRILAAEAAHRAAFGGLHTRVAARSMAAMNVNCGMGVVCAAPTAGSAGVIPGVMATLLGELGLDQTAGVRCLFAAGLIGAIMGERATFAAEVAGCQVEIGAAGAMAAAAVVEAAGGSAAQAADAAAVCFQNTMGSVCDLVQGVVEIPCHTRNAVAASSAFVVADLVMGGYQNPIPLDETIDAVYAVGRMLPSELRVTSLGGLAVAPSALGLKKRS
jgi:L-serine dehydratase